MITPLTNKQPIQETSKQRPKGDDEDLDVGKALRKGQKREARFKPSPSMLGFSKLAMEPGTLKAFKKRKTYFIA